ncbi:MAG: phosphoesterase [Epulopiscium sp.]|nr:phosphoesterase [Candidatus Epulonipiscium sp.]
MKKINISLFLEKIFLKPQLYMAFTLILTIILSFYNPTMGFTFIGFCVVLGVFYNIYDKKSKKEIEHKERLEAGIKLAQKNSQDYLPLPFTIVDTHGWIQWYNDKFESIIEDKNLINKNINSIFMDINSEIFPREEEEVIKGISMDNQHYKAYIYQIYTENVEHRNLYGIYFVDNTEMCFLKQENQRKRVSIGLIFIDNYEEVMQSLEEIRKPLLIALIDRKLNTWAQNIEGIVKKVERDQYLIFFYSKYLDEFKKKRFEILDQVREINIGNELPVTLSIGIGVNGNSLLQSMEYAKAAIDLALGRGGDQAVIKDIDKYSFYGGKTKEVEKSTRVKARMKAYAFRELMEEVDEVIIMGHENPDIDSLGAAIGVYRGAKLLGKKAYIVLNEPTAAIKTVYDRLMKFEEYRKGLFLNNVEAIGRIGEKTLLVVVDVHRPSYTECPELLELSKKTVVFDHHRRSAEFIENAVLTYLEPFISSTCEMIAEILQYIVDKVKLKPIEADILLAGITIDTKNFVFKTGVRTFEAAAFLRRNGADSTRVRMLFQNDMESYKARATAVRDAQIYKENMAISIAPSNIDNGAVIAAQAADELLNISGIIASFVMCAEEDKIMISARALGDINVQLIMEKLGGGGHQTVAGAQLNETSIEEARERLKRAIDEYLEEGD